MWQENLVEITQEKKKVSIFAKMLTLFKPMKK